jgi:multiple sugar transport system substrate-binding protein
MIPRSRLPLPAPSHAATGPALPTRRRAAGRIVDAALGLGAAGLGLPAFAAEQADRAIAAVRQLVARGEIPQGATLRVRAKQGNMNSLLGREHAMQREWERQTGTRIDASAMPHTDSLELIRAGQEVDLTVARSHEYADLVHLGLIENLGPMLERLGFELPTDPARGYMLLERQAVRDGQVVAIPADFDTTMLFLRRDLLEDPTERAAFRARFGRELAAPRTWKEYDELVRWFHRPQEGFYGCCEARDPNTAWMYWMPRYISGALPNQWLFDERMRPLIASPAGIAATEHFLATVPCSPPGILENGRDFTYTLPFLVRGKAFATILTLATAKIAQRDDSAVKGRLMATPIPGTLVGDRLVRRPTFIYGNNLVVPRSSPNKLLALLYALWVTDPENSLRSVTANGIADPYRYHHLRDESVRAVYTPEAVDVLERSLPDLAPSGTGLPGDSQYLSALNGALIEAASGRTSAREAMQRTARQWDLITDRIGRSAQMASWKGVRRLYPGMGTTGPSIASAR